MKPVRTDNSRARDLAAIHMGAAALGMDTKDKSDAGEYRSMLWSCARVRSAADLDFAGRKRVLDHLRACGFDARQHGCSVGNRPATNDAHAAQIGKIEALLAAAGKPWEYVTHGNPSMVKRICGVERIEWANSVQLGKLIAALTIAQRRTQKTV